MDDKDDIDDEDDDKPRSSSDFFGQSSLVTRTGSLSGFQQMAFSSITPKAVLLRFSFPARTSLSSSTRGRQGTFEDSDEDLMAPTPLPPPPSVKAMSEGKGHRKSEETVRDLEMEIEKLQARLEKKRLIEKSEQIASTSESDSTQGQRSDNSVQGQRPDNRECETVPKVERSNSNEVGEELGKATEKAKDSRKDVVIENNINVPLKSADKGDVPISKLLKKDSYSKTTFNQEHFLNSVLSGPPPSAKKDSRGRGALGVPPEAKITGASAKDVHRSPKQIADGVNNDLVGERESLYWKGMGSNPDSGWDVMEEGVFENQFLEVESDVLEITLPPSPNIPHTKATRTGDYVKTEETNSGSSSVKTSDFKSSSVDGFQNESISGETLSVNEHTPDSQNQSGYSDDSMGPPNLPPLKYPDHPPSTSFTSEDSSHSTQLPPKRKSQEMKTSSADGSTLKSELDEKDISDYQEFNNSSRSNYSKVPQTDNNAFHTVSSYTTYMASLQSLADHHGYVIKDVTPDGNCMFSAIVDQLRIQGNFDLTPNSLRKTAVEFLRDNPKNQDGTHLESYLSTETWDEYLTRMGQDSQWGDHMVLQACTEVTGQRIVVFKPNSNKTELVPTDDKSSENSSLTLGHIGESHFVSLRPKDWESSWPLMAHAHRAKMKEKQKLERKKLRKMKKSKKQKQTSESTLPKKEDPKSSDETETEKGAELTEGATQEDEAEREPEKDEDDNSDEDEAESDDSQFKTTDGELLPLLSGCDIDRKSGVPLPHIQFTTRYLIRPDYIRTVELSDIDTAIMCSSNTESIKGQIIGSVAEGLSIKLKDFSEEGIFKNTFTKTQLKRDSRNQCGHKFRGKASIVGLMALYRCGLIGEYNDFYLDTGSANPGYTVIRPIEQCITVPGHFQRDDTGMMYMRHPPSGLLGMYCHTWPECARQWEDVHKLDTWPGSSAVHQIKATPCILLSRAHPGNEQNDQEWQITFPDAENILSQALTPEMKSCFSLFKILVDFHTRQLNVKLKTTHLKTVMYETCELLPATAWKSTSASCLLQLLDLLCSRVHSGVLPNYFIHQNNMIDHFSQADKHALEEKLKAVRAFPIIAFVFMADEHGIEHGWFTNHVFEDCQKFGVHRNITHTIEHTFIPAMVDLATSYINKRKHREACEIMREVYNEWSFEKYQGHCTPTERMDKFFKRIFRNCSDGSSLTLMNHLDKEFGTDLITSKQKTGGSLTMKDIIGKHEAGEHADVFVGPQVRDDVIAMISYLDNYAFVQFSQCRFEDSAQFLRSAISKGKMYLEGGAEINEYRNEFYWVHNTKRMIDDYTIHTLLLSVFSHLVACYYAIGQIDLMQEYILDYEESCDRTGGNVTAYLEVESLWRILGNPGKADAIKEKLSSWERETSAFTHQSSAWQT